VLPISNNRIIDICNIHNKEYTKICENGNMYCDDCDNIAYETYDAESWKKLTLLQTENFRNKLNNKINGLNCIIDITNKSSQSFVKQIEDIIDTILVDINHIDNFNKFINDNDIPISSIIKRKNTILNNEINIQMISDIPDNNTHINEFIKRVIKNDADIHAKDEQCFIWASRNGYLDVVECLLSHGADIHAKDDYAFRRASECGRLDSVKFFIAHGANVHAKNNGALYWASENGHLAVVECLIEHGADIHANKDCALRNASYQGHLDVVKCLIKNGADINAKADNNNYNNSAIRLASENGHLAVVECLIKNGADIHIESDLPICIASENGHLAVVECLINNGANIHACDDKALILASQNNHLDVVKCLVSHGANIHSGLAASPSMALEPAAAPRPDTVGDNNQALISACQQNHLDVIKYLINNGAAEVLAPSWRCRCSCPE
jgi:ankyrin repeat protein